MKILLILILGACTFADVDQPYSRENPLYDEVRYRLLPMGEGYNDDVTVIIDEK